VTPKICVSLLPKTTAEAQTQIAQAEQGGADFIEVRLDCLQEAQSLDSLAKSTKLPLIATNKLQSEGGCFAGSEEARQKSLYAAAQGGFEYVDVDFLSPNRAETIAQLNRIGAKPIVSYHKFDGVLRPAAMERILDEEINCGAAVCKIITTAKQVEDNLALLSFVSFASAKARLVCFCMGEAGKISRLLSPVFGGFFTFASLEKGAQTATGQMSISELKSAYTLLGIVA
jgi:3-dehydroquinate dehydratase type I